MTNAGWYPDPAGQPQTYRYWDGQSWSDETTGDPYAPAPGSTPTQYGTGYGQSGYPGQSVPPAQPGGLGDATVVTPQQPYGQQPTQPPTQPPTAPPPGAPGVPTGYGAIPPSQGPPSQGQYGGGYGQPGYGPLPTSTPPSSGRGSGTTIAIVLIAVLVLVALGVGGFFGVKALTADDDTTAGDDTSETAEESDPTEPTTGPTDPTTGPTDPTDPTTEPTDPTTGPTPTTLQCNGGFPAPEEPRKANQITGGGLVMPVVSGFDVDTLQAGAFTFADEFTPQIRIIEEGWISLYGVGALNKSNGFDSPEQAAEIVTQCMTASTQIYDGFSGRTDLESGPITIDGRDAYSIETEIRVDNPDISVEGDRAQVIVVDTGAEDTWGLYISVVSLDDETLIEQQADTVEQITVK